MIASRHKESAQIGFTVVWYLDLPPDQYKTGQYVYMQLDNEPPVVQAEEQDFTFGTVVRHFGYDLSGYSSPIGPNSLYGILNRVLFDPVTPVWFENKVHGWNRVIKGSRNALHGAVDEGDDAKTQLDHSMPSFNVNLGDLGYIAIEYWVLEKPEKSTSKPSAVFVDPRKPIVLTVNGQNQSEISISLIRKDADLPFLKDRLIVHIDCDRLSHEAKRNLFSSTREQSRSGFVHERITQEITQVLKTDDELRRLNDLAKNESLKETDENAKEQIRKEVAKLFRISGAATVEAGGTKTKDAEKPGGRIVHPRGPRKLDPIPIQEPPTFIRIVWEEEKPIKFYPTQRRYVRIETDANSEYHNPMSPSASRINIIVGDDLKLVGTTPLKGGRMRAGIDCKEGATKGNAGDIAVELYRHGLVALGDSKEYLVVDKPVTKETDKEATFPDFNIIEVKGLDDENWGKLTEDESQGVADVASNSLMNEGTLFVYYSSAFPKFAEEFGKLGVRDPSLALSFKRRYEVWIAFHSLLVYQDQTQGEKPIADIDEMVQENLNRQERCRMAQISVVMAAREARMGLQHEEQE